MLLSTLRAYTQGASVLQIIGAGGIGLVWGWLAVRLCQGARWPKFTRVLLSIVIQALLVAWLTSWQSLLAFGIGLLFGALICAAWLRRLALRYGQP